MVLKYLPRMITDSISNLNQYPERIVDESNLPITLKNAKLKLSMPDLSNYITPKKISNSDNIAAIQNGVR